MNGGVARADLGAENVEAVQAGCANLGRHIENLKTFGVPVVVAVNHFTGDTEAEIKALQDYVAEQGSEAIISRHWEKGSEGSAALATRVAEIADSDISNFAPIYPDEMPLFEKIETIAKRIYRADEVLADKKIRDQLRQWEDQGYGNLPVCMAKTQYSFSDDAKKLGAPKDFVVTISQLKVSAGAGFIVALTGAIMTMPGLPKVPASEKIDVDKDGNISGLF